MGLMREAGSMQKGDTGYIVISNRIIEPVTILSSSGEFCTVHFTSRQGGTRLRKSRVFATKEDAAASIKPTPSELPRRNPEWWL